MCLTMLNLTNVQNHLDFKWCIFFFFPEKSEGHCFHHVWVFCFSFVFFLVSTEVCNFYPENSVVFHMGTSPLYYLHTYLCSNILTWEEFIYISEFIWGKGFSVFAEQKWNGASWCHKTWKFCFFHVMLLQFPSSKFGLHAGWCCKCFGLYV